MNIRKYSALDLKNGSNSTILIVVLLWRAHFPDALLFFSGYRECKYKYFLSQNTFAFNSGKILLYFLHYRFKNKSLSEKKVMSSLPTKSLLHLICLFCYHFSSWRSNERLQIQQNYLKDQRVAFLNTF